jgi:hypothetical protein
LAVTLQSVPRGEHELDPVTPLQAMLDSEDAVAGPVDSCTTFNTSCSDSGPLGIHDASQSDKAGVTMFRSLAGLTHVIKAEFDWAKATLKGKMHRQADDGSTLVPDLGQQLIVPADCAEAIDGVEEAPAGRGRKGAPLLEVHRGGARRHRDALVGRRGIAEGPGESTGLNSHRPLFFKLAIVFLLHLFFVVN